jgi:hypothetical protein
MSVTVPAVLKPPHHEYTGNLLWNPSDVVGRKAEISTSLERFRLLGYWASAYPEGDGVTFTEESGKKRNAEIASDVRTSFQWLEVSVDLSSLDQKAPRRSPMPSLGFEASSKIQKSHAALVQLEDAIDLFLSGKRLSAITLAAAADGVFAGLLKQQGHKPAAEETWDQIEKLREITGIAFAGDRTKKDAFNEWNWHHNRLKHHDKHDEEMLDINVFDHAHYAIKRALADAEKLGLAARNHIEYENWMIEHVLT